VFVASFFFNSRLRTRRAIFCLRNRPDLALSPFLNDIPIVNLIVARVSARSMVTWCGENSL
jgi:hypothetical protein